MKTPNGPQTVAGWKRRALKAEALVETMRGHNLEASGKRMNQELGAYAMGAREVDAVTVRAFKAIDANSRYVRRDNALRKILKDFADGVTSTFDALRNAAVALDMPTSVVQRIAALDTSSTWNVRWYPAVTCAATNAAVTRKGIKR